jgi:hypothetical protein
MTLWESGLDRPPMTLGITDAELWTLVSTTSTRHLHNREAGRCEFCHQAWPCGAERLAALSDEAHSHRR